MPRLRRRRGRIFGIRTGQLVGTQVAAVMLLAGAAGGTIVFATSAFLVVVLLAITWLRLNGRWAFEWLTIAARYTGRRHSSGDPGSATALLEFARPGVRMDQISLAGSPPAVIADGRGLTAVLELGDPGGLLAEDDFALPSPATLLPPPGADHPPCRIQLLLSGVPAPAANGPPATSYRQLTDGQVLGHVRAFLTVRVESAEGWSTDDLVRSLSGLVRRLPRRLDGIPARPLGADAALQAITELAHDDGHGGATESWPGIRVGHTTQAVYRLRRWPDVRAETSRRLVTRLLTLPAATTVAVTAARADPGTAREFDLAGPPPGHRQRAARGHEAEDDGPAKDDGPREPAAVDLTVRIAAPDAAALEVAGRELRRLVGEEDGQVRRLDGEHLDGFAATLPLGVGAPARVPAEFADGLDLTIGAAGVVVGLNRTGAPVVARFFRTEKTQVLLVGGVRGAQLMVIRAMAVGARVVVQTARPHAWERFVSGVSGVSGVGGVGGASGPRDSIVVLAPGHPVQVPAGTALQPLLVVVDVGPVGADSRGGPGWQTTLVVRDDFGPADVDVAARADLLVLQPLRADEAEAIGAAIGLGETAELLTRIRPDMVGLVNRQAVRWAALGQTSIEAHLIGPPDRL